MLETPADVSESSIMCRMECTNGQKQCSSFELGTKSETINILEGLFSNRERQSKTGSIGSIIAYIRNQMQASQQT